MGRPDDRGPAPAEEAMTAHDCKTAAYRARLHLDSASPQSAHEILEPALLSARGAPDRFELLTLLLECCHALGHVEHLDTYTFQLRDLWDEAAWTSAEARVRATASLAKIHSRRGRYAEALGLCRSIDPTVREECSPAAASALDAAEMNALLRGGEVEGAERVVARMLERAERAGDPALEGTARNLMATVWKMRGRFLEAQQLYNQAAGLHRRGGDYAGLTRDLLNGGHLLNRMGLPVESGESCGQALKQAVRIGHRLLILRCSLGLGVAALRTGRLPEARRRLLACRHEARSLRHRREEALALEYLAETATLMGRLAPAQTALSLCERLAARLAPQGDLAAECLLRRALFSLAAGAPQDAEVHARAAITLAAGGSLAWEEAQGWRLLGTAQARRRSFESARESFTRSRALFEGMHEQLESGLVDQWQAYLEAISTGGDIAEPAIHPSMLSAPGAIGTGFGQGGVTRVADGASTYGAVSDPVDTEGNAIAPDEAGCTTSRPAARTPAPDPIWKELGLVTRSARLLRIMEEIRARAAMGDAILILGETGTGKDLLARGIHALSGRKGAFIPFNCAACPADLVESELFGAERGAFTGADRHRSGLALEAAGGTLFLDEIGDLPARAQGAVLRFTDQGEVRALGSSIIRKVELGLVAATHHPLHDRVESGAFRRDLYYRLAQGILEIPPLRERGEDLDLLVQHIWTRLNPGSEPPGWLMQEGTLRTLRAHAWPGNVRELELFVRAVRMRPDRPLRPEQIRLLLQAPRGAIGTDAPTLEEIEQTIRLAGGNRRQAAAMLGISRARLYRLLEAKGGRKTHS